MRSEINRLLAFDFGASNGRAVVGTIDKQELSIEEIHRFPNEPVFLNDNLYWNFGSLYNELLQGLKVYRKNFGPRVDSVGVDTWGVDFGLLDRRGNLVALPFHHRDDRIGGTDALIEEKLGSWYLYQRNGIQFLLINTINQFLALVRDDDPTLNITERFLFMGDLFNYFLTGNKVAEYTLATISQLYNTVDKQWDEQVFEKVEIPFTIAPPVIDAGTSVGTIKQEITDQAGLERTEVIAPAIHDTASAAVAVPAEREGGDWAFLSSGTWSILGFELDAPVIDRASYEMNVSNSGGVLGKTLYLKNVMGLWIIQSCKRQWDEDSGNLQYEDIVVLAKKTKDLDIYIDPDDARFLNPKDMLAEIMTACREQGYADLKRNDIGAISKIVYQSLALKYRYTLEKLVYANKRSVDTLYIVGGGCKNELLNQYTANALGVRVITGPVEATAIGNLSMQAVGKGHLKTLDQIRSMIRDSFTLDSYQPENRDQWEEKYRQFKKNLGL